MHVNWSLDGTYLEVVPEAAGAWLVIDSRNPDRRIAIHLDLKKAREAAEQIHRRAPWSYDKP